MTTKIQKQIEERIDEKICVSEINIDMNRFIKEIKSLSMRAYDLEAVLDLLKEQNTKSSIELIDKLIMFNEFADKLNIRLVLWLKNLGFSFLKIICSGKNLNKDLLTQILRAKVWHIVHYYHLHYFLCLNSLILIL